MTAVRAKSDADLDPELDATPKDLEEDETDEFGGGYTLGGGAARKATPVPGGLDDEFDIDGKLTTDDDAGGFGSFDDGDDFAFNDGESYSDDY